jgi:hypothetical protein
VLHAEAFLGALAFSDIDVCADYLDKLSMLGEQMMANCFEIFDCSIGEHDSEIDPVISFLPQCFLGLFVHPVSVAWMDPSPHSFAVRETLHRIKPPDSVTLLRPIENFRRSRT